MKKKAFGFIAFAMTLMASMATFGAGDIVSIDPCDEYGFKVPVDTTPKSAGQTAYFRIRLLNPNCRQSYDTRNNPDATKRANPWQPDYSGLTVGSGAMEQMWLANPPKIGVIVSGQLRGAAVGYPYAVTVDDDGSWAGWYTDLICSYTVKPGDIALPMTLANANGDPIGSGYSGSYYFNTIPRSSVWNLIAYERDDAWNPTGDPLYCTFAIYDRSPINAGFPPTYTPEWTTGDIDLTQAGIYLQTIDFAASEYSVPGRRTAVGEGGQRNVTMNIVGGANTNGNGTVYVMTKDTNTFTIAENNMETVTFEHDPARAMDGTYQVAKVTIPSGVDVTSFSFKIKGVTPDTSGTVYISTTKEFTYGGVGDLVTNFISAVVNCTAPEKPKVTVTIDDLPATAVTASADYETSHALTVTLSEAYANDFDVMVTPKMANGGSTDPLGKYVGVSTRSVNGYNGTTQTVHFAAGETTQTLYVYILGGSDDTANDGIEFDPSVPDATAAAFFNGAHDPAVLRIKKSKPVILYPTGTDFPEDSPIVVDGGVSSMFSIQVADSYSDLRGEYTIQWDRTGSSSNPTQYTGNTPTIEDGHGVLSHSERYAAGNYKTRFRVKNSSEEWSDWMTISVRAREPKTVSAVVEDPDNSLIYNEFSAADEDNQELTIRFTLTEGYDNGTLYAFLVPLDEASSNLVTCRAFTQGVPIRESEIESTGTTQMRLLDGTADTDLLQYEIVLRTARTWTSGETIGSYASKNLEITVRNVAPAVTEVKMSGSAPVTVNGGTFGGKASLGLNKIFSLSANDVDADLTADVTAQWTFSDPNGNSVTRTVTAPIDDLVLTNVFEVAGTYDCTVKLRDKDMSNRDFQKASAFAFKVVVLDTPSVQIVFPETDQYNEMDVLNRKGFFYVELSTAATKELDVEIACTQDGADGVFSLAATTVHFRPGQTRQKVDIADLDGTAESMSARGGFTLTATVTTETPNEDGIALKDVYLPATEKVFVMNENPTIVLPMETGVTNDAAINVNIPIKWKISDVGYDMTNDLLVTWTTSEGRMAEFRGSDVFEGVFTNMFTSGGAKTVTITVTDKDDGSASVTLYYRVAPSKRVNVYPQGPYYGGGLSPLAKRYVDAYGRGEGRVWSKSGSTLVEDFVHKYTFGFSDTLCELYAWGYLNYQVDDGNLVDSTGKGGRDVPISTFGDSFPMGSTFTADDCYVYTDREGRDCFFYAWVIETKEEEASSYTGTALVQPPVPSMSGRFSYYGLSLPTEQSGDDARPVFADRYIEAFFSKELNVADNMGDMNADGIPDYFATMSWSMDSGEAKPICEAMTGQAIAAEGGEDGGSASASDLTDVSSYNDDGDFLPMCWSHAANPLKPALPNWGPGEKFSALYEIRGIGMSGSDLHLGLNELDVSDYDLSHAERCALLADYAAAGNTLTGTYADDYAAATNWAKGVRWTPEAINPRNGSRLNPLKPDTDGDGFDDGWEYFFWYHAKIGAVTNGVWGRLEGRRFDITAPATGTRITSDEIVAAFNPHTATVGGRDFDNDGLTDLEEYILGTNPCDWDSDGDGMNDLWEVMNGLNPLSALDAVDNPDRDFMAKCEYAADTFTVFTFANGEMFGLPTTTDPKVELMPLTSGTSTNGFLMAVEDNGATNYYITAASQAAGALADDVEALPAVISGDTAYLAGLTAVTVASGANVVEAGSEEAEFQLISGFYGATVAGSKSKIWFAEPPKVFMQNDDGIIRLAVDTAGFTTFTYDGTDYLGESRVFPAGTLFASIDTEVANMNQVSVTPYVKTAGGFSWINPKTLEREPTYLALPLFSYGGDGSMLVPCSLTIDKYSAAPVAPDADLAEAAGIELPAGFVNSPLVKVETGRKVTLIHAQVIEQYGFDPRVAWTIDDFGYVDQRWRKTDSSESDGLGATGLATNTVAYTSRDEYLVMQYRQQMRAISDAGFRSGTQSLLHGGEIYLLGAGATASTGAVVSPNASVNYFRLATTYPNFPVAFVRAAYAQRNEISPFENSTNSFIVAYWTWLEVDNDIHGADTDQDGIPDGWELYVNADPNNYDDGKLRDDWANDDDEINLLEEYAGVDSCNAYTNRFLVSDPTKMIYPEADTITKNHPGRKSGWWNKFFPTNPYSPDTDGDGVKDHAEGRSFPTEFSVGNNWYGAKSTSFIYGRDENAEKYDMDGTTTCFRGGGLNPCTVDTDSDLLPDAWEFQFAGLIFTDGAPAGDIALLNDDLRVLTMADGKQKAVKTSGSEIRGGMDGTWKGDACFDFDHDGLVNCQEYLVQTLRHLRYDDNKTPLMGIDPNSRQFLKFLPFSAWDGEFFHKKCLDNGFTGLGSWQFSKLGYFTRPPHEWDMLAQNDTGNRRCANYEDWEGKGYRVLLPPTVEIPLIGEYVLWIDGCMHYACTDPRRWDSDEDGMDDYYELFHGLNPLLGTIANPLGNDDYGWVNNRYDVIARIHGSMATAWSNFWTGWNMDEPPPFDAMRYPWVIGTMECDADGDGLRNDEEAIKHNLAKPTNTHTDPTPLWMTDSTSVDHASFTSQYYCFDPYIVESPDYDPNLYYPDVLGYPWNDIALTLRLRAVGVAGEARTWMFSFEENEGYDTDHDFRCDAAELTLGVEMASDPKLFSDPNRRQALYFPGSQSAAMSRDGQFRRAVSTEPDLFKQFTVECWVKPEGAGKDAVLVERICNYGPSTLSNSTSVLRANFRVGLDGSGRAYGEIEGTTANASKLRVTAPTALESDKWTHIAFTFDGEDAKIYLNGDLAPVAIANNARLLPANGIYGIQQEYNTSVMGYGYVALPCATVLGADVVNGNALMLNEDSSWSDFDSYFKGWIDEVRIWDGARTAQDIHANYAKRFTMSDVKEMRSNEEKTGIFDQWAAGLRRSSTTGLALPAELIQHYNFVTLPGGIDPVNVMTEPAMFQENVFDNVRKPNTRALDNSLLAGWWSKTPLHSMVYWNYAVIPWIGNTVAHLPFMDGSSPDSQYWSSGLAGVVMANTQGFASYDYPNEANPYPYFLYHRERSNRLQMLETIENLTSTNSSSSTSNSNTSVVSADSMAAKWMFQLRSEFLGTSDLVPLGGAYAKRGTDFWDNQGAMDAWSETAKEGEVTDTDGNGIPDWAEALGLTTSEAYLRALAKGLLPTATSATDFNAAYASLIDTNYDGVPDWWQKMYGVSGSAQQDTDKDGLADFAEYLISEVFDFDGTNNISPVLPMSNGKEFDYFRKLGKLYLGEMFSDHDFMEDHLEREWAEIGAQPAYYDAQLDSDEDGWSNWAEVRAKHDMGYEVTDTGIVKTNVIYQTYVCYDRYKSRLDTVLSHATDYELMETDFNILGYGHWFSEEGYLEWHNDFYGNGYIKYRVFIPVYANTYAYKGQPEPTVTMTVRYKGMKDLTGVGLTIQAYTDEEMKRPDAVFTVANGDNRNVNTLTFKYPGDGYLREGKNTFVVSVGAASNVTASASIMGVARNVDVGWSKVAFDVELTEQSPICSRPAIAADTNGASRVYVYRYTVDNEAAPAILTNRMVLTKDVGSRSYLHEGDFLSDAEFDIDWANFQREVVRNGVVSAERFPVTSVTYRAYFSPVDVRSSAVQTNTAIPYVQFARRFGRNRATAVPVAPGDDATIFYGARPTFRWRLEGEMPDSYTAFALQVKDGSGAVVWNSGARLAPPRNADGEYVWEAPLYAGDQTPLCKVFATTNNYTWAVTMFNSKFQSEVWSASRTFRVNVYAPDEVNNTDRYAIKASVKYFGPGKFTTYAERTTNSIVRVEAYTSPDFSGEPAGRTFIRDYASMTNAEHDVNATIIGLKAGTYYVRAFIDSDGDFKRSAWESWGYACPRGDTEKGAIYAPKAVVIGDGQQTSVTTMYVEDCDVDQDCLPDVWEYDTAGEDKTEFWLKKGPMANANNGYIGVNPELQSSINNLINGGSSLQLLAAINGNLASSVAALVLGVDSVEPKLDEKTLAIKSLTFADGKVTLTLGAEADDPTAGTVFVTDGMVRATVVVKYADSLGGEWKSVEKYIEKKVEDGAVSEEISFSLEELGLDATKGFFKVELKQ